MKYLIYILSFLIITSSYSCGNKKKKDNDFNQQSFENGKLIENVNCLNDFSVTYSLYLPKSYDSSKRYPLVIAFDPHGKGSQPLDSLMEIANLYNYILVGSNNSKNGIAWEETSKIYDILIDDIFKRFSIDKSRIYTIGFSGGARVASTVAIIKGGISGVVGCSGGFPPIDKPIKNQFDFVGIAGNMDMNFLEMETLNRQLDNSVVKHILLTFDGKHGWPPKSTLSSAFLWIELSAMKENKKAQNRSFIDENYRKMLDAVLLVKNNPYNQYVSYKNLINFFSGLKDTNLISPAISKLKNLSSVKLNTKNEIIEINKEMFLQKKYQEYINSKPVSFWKGEVLNLNNFIKKTTIESDKNMIIRILEYLSLCSFSYTNSAIQKNDWQQAQKYDEIYCLVDPDNNEAFYLQAVIYSKLNNADKSIKSLEKAADLDFSDIGRVENDTILNKIRSYPQYKDIIEKIKQNSKTKN